MTYLDIARRADFGTKETKEVRIDGHAVSGDGPPKYERNESNEKSPLASVEGSASLQARIIAAATVDPAHFDRPAYDALWRQWHTENAQ